MKKAILLLAIINLCWFASCSDDEDTTLSVSVASIDMESAGGEKTVEVTTNGKFSAIASNDWIQTKIDNNNLLITIAPNESIDDRKGTILLVAGATNTSIQITQKGVKATIIGLPKSITLADSAGSEIIEICANDPRWSVASNAEWLKLEAKQFKSELILTYNKNEDLKDRIAIVTISIGKEKIMLHVKQLAKMVYILPCPNFGNVSRKEVMDFEAARKNQLKKEYSNELMLYYQTRSTMLFPKMKYFFYKRGTVKECKLYVISFEALENNIKNISNHLMANGYEQQGEKLSFINKKEQVIAEISFNCYYNMEFGYVTYSPIIKQPEMPTFKKFPYPLMEWEAKRERIDTYESENNGKYNDIMSFINPNGDHDMLVYDRDQKDEAKTVHCIYYVRHEDQEKAGLMKASILMKNIDLVFFLGGKTPVLTKEFKALCEKEGFTYKKASGSRFYFEHQQKKIKMNVAYKKYDDIGKVVNLTISPM